MEARHSRKRSKKSILRSIKKTWARRIRTHKLATLIVILVLLCSFFLLDFLRCYTAVRVSDEGYTHGSQFVNSIVINGTDISEHQGDDINWRKLKASGIDFVFIRAGYRAAESGGLNEDPCFTANYRRAKRAGLLVGAYYYSQALNPAEAEEEAGKLLDIAGGRDFDLPLAIDYEIYPGGRLDQYIDSGNLNASSLYHDIVLAFCSVIEKAGYDSAIYANTDMFTHYMDSSLIDDSSNLWVAEYASSCSLGSGYRFWQCSDSCEVGGIDQMVDHDFMYINAQAVTRLWYCNANDRVSLEGCSIELKKDQVRYSVKGARVKLKVYNQDGKRLREGRDYTVGYVNNTERGIATAFVRGIGDYRDIICANYTVK